MNFTGVKDTDRYFLESLDDRQLFTVMQTNKEYLKLAQDFFEKRMKKRYPILAVRKPEDVTWFKYYIDNVFYISKLKEDYDLDYYNVPSFYPKTIYHNIYYAISPPSSEKIKDYKISFLVENGEYEKARKYIEDPSIDPYERRHFKMFLLSQFLKIGNIPLFEKIANEYGFKKPYLYRQFLDYYHEFIKNAAKSGKEEIIDYIIIIISDLGIRDSYEILHAGIEGAIISGKLDTIDYFIKKYPKEQIDWFLSETTVHGENLKLFKESLEKDFQKTDRREEFLNRMKEYNIIGIIKEGKLDFLKYAIEMYKAHGGDMKDLIKNINHYFEYQTKKKGILDRDIHRYIQNLEKSL